MPVNSLNVDPLVGYCWLSVVDWLLVVGCRSCVRFWVAEMTIPHYPKVDHKNSIVPEPFFRLQCLYKALTCEKIVTPNFLKAVL